MQTNTDLEEKEVETGGLAGKRVGLLFGTELLFLQCSNHLRTARIVTGLFGTL